MRSVMFNFRSTVSPERQEAILAQINAWDGVSNTGRLKPDAKRQEILRMCYAYIADSVDSEAIVERLSSLPELESVSPPTERGLI